MNIDLTLCPGTGCPLKEKCKRYTAGVKAIELGFSPLWWMEPEYRNRTCKNLMK